MLLKELRTAVLEANLELVKRGLVLYTFGNASGIDRDQGLVVIKPSGVDYDELIPEFMIVTDLHGNIIDGKLKPSSDLDTHTLLYREFQYHYGGAQTLLLMLRVKNGDIFTTQTLQKIQDITRQVTSTTIAYEDAGMHELRACWCTRAMSNTPRPVAMALRPSS